MKPRHKNCKSFTVTTGAPSHISRQILGEGGKEAVEASKRRAAARSRCEELRIERANREPWEVSRG